MFTFFLRRLLTSSVVVLVSTFVMYILVDIAIDPLSDLYTSTSPNKDQLIANRIALLRLDDPVVVRYLDWLKGASGCLVGNCDLGENWRKNQEVTSLLAGAIGTTLQLVSAATLLAILLGVMVGIVSALRQYSGFDYSITFLSFLLYSLPVFWVAVLAKAYLAIKFNDFLFDPEIPVWVIVAASLAAGLVVSAAVGGARLLRLETFAGAALVTAAIAIYLNLTDWFVTPSIGIVLLGISSVAWAFALTAVSTGLRNRKALYSALTVAGLGVAIYYPMLYFWAAFEESWLLVIGLALLAIAVSIGVGYAWGGNDRSQSARTAAFTAVPVSTMLFVDRLLQSWPGYVDSNFIKGRPIATFSRTTPNFTGSFWFETIDLFTHLLLPTLTLILISFAGYTRYSRASMLEVMNQDYIRTARAKGLTERTVIMRHAFRNALLPLASIVPVDIITLIGGAVLTETVFSWFGMGKLFVDSLGDQLQDPVMAYVLVVGIFAVIANFFADLIYAVLDPRIRVSA